MTVQDLSPRLVQQLRAQPNGIERLAAAAQRRPGVVNPLPGGLEAIRRQVGAQEPWWWWRDLLSAVAMVESRGDANAVSPTGALGPYQLTSWIYEHPVVINPFRWDQATVRAATTLRDLYRRARGVAGPLEDPLAIALEAWKEGWRGRTASTTRAARARQYRDRVFSVLDTLPDWWVEPPGEQMP